MNLQEIRDRTWSVLETDEDEFPTALLDAFALDGYNRIVGTDRRWPTFQTSSVVNVLANVPFFAVGGSQFVTAMREVTSLVNVTDKTRLYQRPYQDALEAYGTDTGTPEAWSVWGGNIYLWPRNDSNVTLTAIGFRDPERWWTDPSREIDCDSLLHMSILYFVLSRCFARMEDTELAGFYEQMFVSGVSSVAQTVMQRNTADDPLVLHGGGSAMFLDRPHLTHGF